MYGPPLTELVLKGRDLGPKEARGWNIRKQHDSGVWVWLCVVPGWLGVGTYETVEAMMQALASWPSCVYWGGIRMQQAAFNILTDY